MAEKVDFEKLLSEFRSDEYRKLRPGQKEVLDRYVTEFSEVKDVAVELPTGAGKSLIALLIGEMWRRKNKKVAILTANKTLARQMEKMAASLGVPAVRMEGAGPSIPAQDKRSYHRASSLGIMNYWVYFNQNPVIDPAGLLIMDDAHLAEHCLHSLFSVEISRSEHKNLFETLVSELAARFPEYAVLQDACDAQKTVSAPTELLSFLDQSLVADRIREIVDASPAIESNQDLRFRWRRLREKLEEANLYISHGALWFRPAVYPLIVNSQYENADQRLYMSATIGDSSDLARRLGVGPISKIPVPEELSITTYGRRMIVMNKIEDKDIPRRLQLAIIAALNVHPKSIWLCESTADAEKYQKKVATWLNANGFVGHASWLLTSLGDEIDAFKQAEKGHLFVGGRFDGMDFKAGECRLVVLATLPRAINAQEEFFTSYLRDAGFMLKRLNHRIVQALGRCNRDAEDFGVYVLADRRFATHFGRESNRLGIPRNIMAEIDCAEDDTEIAEEDLAKKITTFLNKDFSDFDKNLKSHQEAVPAKSLLQKNEVDVSNEEVLGWAELFEHKNFTAARELFQICAEKTRQGLRELSAFHQWCFAKATFLLGKQNNLSARSEAPDLLESAIEQGGKSSWFNRLRSSLNRYRSSLGVKENPVQHEYAYVVLHGFDDILERCGPKGTRFQKWADRISACLRSESHAEYQEGLEELGSVLGFSASRPKYGASTDCRWRGVFGNFREVVTFEAKIEHEAGNKIIPHHVGQAHNQLTRAKEEYGNKGFVVRGTIVTHLSDLEATVSSSLGEVRIVKKDAVLDLWNTAMGILSLYRDQWSLDDVDARLTAGESLLPRFPAAGWLTRALANDSNVISSNILLNEWK